VELFGASERVSYEGASRPEGDALVSTDAKKDDEHVRVSRRVECLGPGKTILMPDIYADEYAANEMHIEVLDESSSDIKATGGFNPYHTAALRQK
jgi:hypothetical protein